MPSPKRPCLDCGQPTRCSEVPQLHAAVLPDSAEHRAAMSAATSWVVKRDVSECKHPNPEVAAEDSRNGGLLSAASRASTGDVGSGILNTIYHGLSASKAGEADT
jgi:hypothetical protein